MRKSHEGLHGIIKDNYDRLPEELKDFNYYYNDGETGHVIMAVPEILLEKYPDEDLDMLECPFPVKYVLANGFRIYNGHIICSGEYDEDFGLEIDEEWFEI